MRILQLFFFICLIGIWGINCQEVFEEEDKDGASGSGDEAVGVIGDEVDNDDEDTEITPTDSDEIDIDETTIPSTTDIQSEEPTTTEEKPTSKEMPTTTDEELTIAGSGTGEPTDTEGPTDTDDTESPTTEGEGSGDGTEKPTIVIQTEMTTDGNEVPGEKTTSIPYLPSTTIDGNEVDNGVMGDDGPSDTNFEEADANARTSNDENGGLNGLTTEVVAAVVVGAVCAIIIIAFLVYRLKKRDEGSYALDESTHYTNKDAYKFSAEGKEAFV